MLAVETLIHLIIYSLLNEPLLSASCAGHPVSKTEESPVFKEFIACEGDRKPYKQLKDEKVMRVRYGRHIARVLT